MRVLITGATGFLGYHITKACLDAGHEVLCLRRPTSKNPFAPEYAERIGWFELDQLEAEGKVRAFSPDVLIHAAWEGLERKFRDDDNAQRRNVKLQEQLLSLFSYKQVIVLGSMEEYGYPGVCMTENTPVAPFSAYTRAKIECFEAFRDFALKGGLEWQWIRVFPAFGENQQESWLIPSLISDCLSQKEVIETTPGEQLYSFLYAEDFGRAIVQVIGAQGKSGVYNLGASRTVYLRELFDLIAQKTGFWGRFSKDLPYRGNKTLTVTGDFCKFVEAFSPYEQTTLEDGLDFLIHRAREKWNK